MSKYHSKQQLLSAITTEQQKLDQIINELTPKQVEALPVCDKWTPKDLLCHIARWQEMVLDWYNQGLKGETPKVPHEKYNWGQLPDLNNEIYLQYKDYTIEQAFEYYKEMNSKTLNLINSLDEATLLQPGLYAWMNKNTLIAYLGSDTASHYLWASSLIRKAIRKKVKAE